MSTQRFIAKFSDFENDMQNRNFFRFSCKRLNTVINQLKESAKNHSFYNDYFSKEKLYCRIYETKYDSNDRPNDVLVAEFYANELL